MLGVAGPWGLGLPVGMRAWGLMRPRGHSGWALVVLVRVAVHVCEGGPSGDACEGPFVGQTGGLWYGWGSGLACVGAADWWPRVDASGGVRCCGPGSPAGPGPWLVCGRTVPRGCLGQALAVAVFVWLVWFPYPQVIWLVLPDRCGCVVLQLVSLRRSFGCRFLPGALWRAGPRWRLNARSPCGVGGLRPVWSVDGPVGGGGGRAGGRGGRWALWRAGPRWCQSVYICGPCCSCGAQSGLEGNGRGSACGGGGAVVSGTSGHPPGHCHIAVRAWPRRWDEWLLGAPRHWHEAAVEGYPPLREIGRHQPLGGPLDQVPTAVEEITPLVAMCAGTIPMAHSLSPTSQPKVSWRRVVRVRTVVRQLSRFIGLMGPQLSRRLPTGGRLPRGTSL